MGIIPWWIMKLKRLPKKKIYNVCQEAKNPLIKILKERYSRIYTFKSRNFKRLFIRENNINAVAFNYHDLEEGEKSMIILINLVLIENSLQFFYNSIQITFLKNAQELFSDFLQPIQK